MIDSGDYITPVYNDKKRFAKPIIFYWMVAASYKMFGVNLFSARLVSSFFGSLCIPIVYMISRRLFDRKIAAISALLLPGCYLHFQISRWAITDMTLNFFMLSTFYFFIRGLQDESAKNTSYYFAYICMGIGFMIKGPPAIIIPALVILGVIIISRNWKELSQLQLGHGTMILAAIILPWFITMLVTHGNEFKNHILGAELRDRIIHDTPFSLYYFGVIIRYYLPWSFFFIAALLVKFGLIPIAPRKTPNNESYFLSLSEKLHVWYRNIIHKSNQAFLLSIIWITAPLILFTLFRIEHSRYMLPVSAPIVMITAQFLSQMIDSPSRFQHKIFKVPFYLTITFYTLIAILIWTGVFFLLPLSQAPVGLLIFSFLTIFGLISSFLLFKSKKYFSMVIALSITQIITLTSLSGDSLSFFNRYPMKKFANQILADPQINKSIGLYQLGNHRARIGVLTGLPSIYLNNPTELKSFLKLKENPYIIMRQSDWQQKFFDLPVNARSTDAGWKALSINKGMTELLFKGEVSFNLPELSESYILLKKTDTK